MLLTTAPAAGAASIAYVDGGEVWLSSLDGAQKTRLAAPVVNGGGQTEQWLAVAASDTGRIVAVRNVPGSVARSSARFRVWEPNGTSTLQGTLNAPTGWLEYVYPLGFDVTADGAHMAYGYSNTSDCCPETVGVGTYVRPVTNSALDPIDISGQEHPTLFGSRVIAHLGELVNVQATSGAPYATVFTGWQDLSTTGLDVRRTDVAANGQLAAIELEEWTGDSQTIGKIGVMATQGVDQAPTFAVDCTIPASGVATGVSLSADATRLAWADDQGLKVAGTPTTAVEPCALSPSPVVISATASQGSIGAANVTEFLPERPPTLPPAGGPPTNGNPTAVVTLPRRVRTRVLAGPRGVPIKVEVSHAGKVRIRGTVPARVLRRRGKPVIVAKGSATAARAGTLTVRLRMTRIARRQRKRLKGARMTLRVTQGNLSIIKRVRLR